MNAVERKESETPSTPCSSMTPSLEASLIGVSTTASILSQALRNPSSALRGENFLLSVRTMVMGLDTDTDMDMDTARKVKKQQPNHISPTSQVIQLSFAIILLLWTSAIMTAFNCSLSQLRSL